MLFRIIDGPFLAAMIPRRRNTKTPVAVGVLGLLTILAMLAPVGRAQEGSSPAAPQNRRWQVIAPGEVEPVSGEIKIGSSVVGRIAEVTVKVMDRVFAGELLIRLEDDELRARVTVAEAQVALQKRLRNDSAAGGRAIDRRRAEDAVADAEKAVVDAQSAVDRTAAAGHDKDAPDSSRAAVVHVFAAHAALEARTTLSRAQDRLRQQLDALRKLDVQSSVPLPNQLEGQLNVARGELAYANANLEKMRIRAPIACTVLQVNAKVGELTSPSSVQPLISLGDMSALRVRAEVSELNMSMVKVGQPVMVRAAAFRQREFAGKVSSIAATVEPRRIGTDGQRAPSDSKFVRVIVDLIDPAPLEVGMSVDVYFQNDVAQ
jgi:HlyD family secretion protein